MMMMLINYPSFSTCVENTALVMPTGLADWEWLESLDYKERKLLLESPFWLTRV